MLSEEPMRIAVLSRDPSLYSTSRLLDTGEQRGHKMYVIDYLRCYLDINHDRPRVLYQGRDLNFFDAVIPRIGASNTFYGAAVVRQFELMQTFCLNDSQAIVDSRDKLRCHQLLAAEGIQLPVTGCAHSTKDVDGLIDVAGGPPVVVKLVEGTQGAGVILAETRAVAQAVIEAFRVLDANILVQEYVSEASGADIRCFVVGSTVVASMRRQAESGDFRSNLHRGGSAEAVEISVEERELAIHAAETLGLQVAGVDILRSQHGPVVIEVNSSPGLQGIEESTGEDIATMIFEYIETTVELEPE